jgi:hypothetical protein
MAGGRVGKTHREGLWTLVFGLWSLKEAMTGMSDQIQRPKSKDRISTAITETGTNYYVDAEES